MTAENQQKLQKHTTTKININHAKRDGMQKFFEALLAIESFTSKTQHFQNLFAIPVVIGLQINRTIIPRNNIKSCRQNRKKDSSTIPSLKGLNEKQQESPKASVDVSQ